MPEMQFRLRWPDGEQTICYSPSLVIRDYFDPGSTYPLAEFRARSRAALTEASERVRAKYGFACTRALGQLAEIERCCDLFATTSDPLVTVMAFHPAAGPAELKEPQS